MPMRSRLFSWIVVTGLLCGAGAAGGIASASAAPFPAVAPTPHGLIEPVYYYRGHYYPYHYNGHYYHYRYNGHYYNRRYHYHGGWHYY